MHREHDDVRRVPGEEAEAGLDRIAVAPDHFAHLDAEARDGASGTVGGNQPPALQRVANPREIVPGHCDSSDTCSMCSVAPDMRAIFKACAKAISLASEKSEG